jgi:hypothetical protein
MLRPTSMIFADRGLAGLTGTGIEARCQRLQSVADEDSSLVRKRVKGDGVYPENGAHGVKPWRAYKASAGWNMSVEPVSRLSRS